MIANGRVKEAKAIIQKACKQNKKNYEDVAAASGFHTYEMQSGITTVEIKKGIYWFSNRDRHTHLQSQINAGAVSILYNTLFIFLHLSKYDRFLQHPFKNHVDYARTESFRFQYT